MAGNSASFFASHELIASDKVILRKSAQEIVHSIPSASVWLLLFDAERKGPMEQDRGLQLADLRTAVWGEDAVRLEFPRLWDHARGRSGIGDSGASAKANGAVHDGKFYSRFDWFHCSLLLWFRRIGYATQPSVQWFWRLELDVLFSGPFDALLLRSAREPADVLLPGFQADENESATWPFWTANRHLLAAFTAANLTHAMVSIGRFSRRFILEVMAPLWTAGLAGFEEALIPMACANLSGGACTLARFGAQSSVSDARFAYRPPWRCAEYVSARKRRTHELWHPVKTRECVARFLEATQGNRTLELRYQSKPCAYEWCRVRPG